jgi:hypothetical protein
VVFGFCLVFALGMEGGGGWKVLIIVLSSAKHKRDANDSMVLGFIRSAGVSFNICAIMLCMNML